MSLGTLNRSLMFVFLDCLCERLTFQHFFETNFVLMHHLKMGPPLNLGSRAVHHVNLTIGTASIILIGTSRASVVSLFLSAVFLANESKFSLTFLRITPKRLDIKSRNFLTI